MIPNPTRREFLALLGAGTAGLLASACGSTAQPSPSSVPSASPNAPAKPAASVSTSPSATAAAKPLTTIKITDIQITSAAGSYIAGARGYFKDEGIQAEFVRMGSGDQFPALVSGTADVTGTAIEARLYNALARDVPLKIVADHGANLPNASANGIAIRKDLADAGKWKGPADMKGWRIGRGAVGATAEIALARWLKTGGLTPKDVEFVQLGFPEMLPAFANKNIEASQFQEPFTTLAINQGLIVRGPIGYDMYPFQQIGVVAVGPKLVNDRDLSVRFLRAYTRGVRDYVKGLIQKDPATFDQVVPILIEHTAVKERALFEKAIPSGLKADPLPNVQSIVDDQDYFVASGVVQQKIDMSKYIDLSMIEQVIKELGPAK